MTNQIIEIKDRTSNPTLSKLRFVLGAMDIKDNIIWRQHVLIEEGDQDNELNVVGTDGRKLHVSTTASDDLGFPEPGLYRVLKNIKSHVILLKTDNDAGMSFPCWRSLFEDCGEDFFDVSTGDNITGCVNVLSRIYQETLPHGKAVNPELLPPLGERVWRMGVNIDNNKVVFIGPDKKAAIIMMRVDPYEHEWRCNHDKR